MKNKGMAKAIWRGIRYLRRDNRLHVLECDYNGSEWWEYWNGSKCQKYSYRWVCKWVNEHPTSNVWEDLFQKDEYLKMLCSKYKVSMLDQLVYYGEEWTCRK